MIYQLDTTRKVITLKGTYPIKEVLKEIKKIDGWEEYSLEQEVHPYNPYFIPTVPYNWQNIPFINCPDITVPQGEYQYTLPLNWVPFNTCNQTHQIT